MATLPARRSGRNLTIVNPSREFEDIYDRMGQLMNMAFGGLGSIAVADLPWSPLADLSETDDAYVVNVELRSAVVRETGGLADLQQEAFSRR